MHCFTCRAGGIPRDEARMMLSVAFMSDVIDHVCSDSGCENVPSVIEKRFRGELANASVVQFVRDRK